ncbi:MULTISPECIES: hypothetical protein [Streptomyces]|uniref:hypothetical protein n=1 Tax=Streptomyces TaxID=1883 RepID=UPI001C0EAA62|nr:hypothetical protein [Streptomyces kasugaensis]
MNEIAELQRRVTNVERTPAPVNRFDRYPVVEWAAQSRPAVADNVWASCSIANVTGMVFDRVECKFITDWLLTGRREAEIRLAAFRHTSNNEREIVSASSVLELNGYGERNIGRVLIRWVHGIPYGWDYGDNNTVYTIELQHRYKTGPEPYKPNRVQVAAVSKLENTPDPGLRFVNVGGSKTGWVIAAAETPGGGWVTIPEGQVSDNARHGTYSISAMHYCVGLPDVRIPEASPSGWFWARGSDSKITRSPDITEPHFTF